jgi:branched-chain amino acid transport system substrate-binding protein
VFGQLIVEGLKRTGRDLTRESFVDAMESIKNWDSKGIMPQVSFSKADHHAQKAGFIAELKERKFQPITGWIQTE